MERTVEGTHTDLLRQITGKPERRRTDGMWVTLMADEVQEAAGMQLAANYIGHIHGTVD